VKYFVDSIDCVLAVPDAAASPAVPRAAVKFLAAERRALAESRQSAQLKVESKERRARGDGAIELENLSLSFVT
jgi:hypothetical protein